MTKKKIRYSDLPAAPPSPEPTAAAPSALPVPASVAVPPVAAAEPTTETATEPARRRAPRREPSASAAPRPAAPLDLARALAAARSAEQAAAALVPAPETPPASSAAPASPAAAPAAPAGGVVIGRLTPLGGNVIIRRDTPMRGSAAIPRPAGMSPAPTGDPATPSLRERARLRRGMAELLVFAVGRETFAVELARVEEAIDLPAVRHIPEMPPAMLGVATVRNALTPVYGPESALGLAQGARASALVFKRERGRIGIAVDDVDDVHTLDLADLRDAPGLDATDGILLGVLRYRDGLLALVDAEALITACQTVPLMETA